MHILISVLLLKFIYAEVAFADSKVPLAVSPVNLEEKNCPEEKPPSVWRWGQKIPGGSPIPDGKFVKIRIKCKEYELPADSLLFDQYKIYVLKREEDKAEWWDIEDGKIYRSEMLLNNAVASGEVVSILIPSADNVNRIIHNRRTSNFFDDKDFKAGEVYTIGLYKQIVFILNQKRQKDKKFQEFVKSYVETNKVKIPVPFKATVELLQAQYLDIVKMVRAYDLQNKK